MASNKKEFARLERKIKALALSVVIFELAMIYITNSNDQKIYDLEKTVYADKPRPEKKDTK